MTPSGLTQIVVHRAEQGVATPCSARQHLLRKEFA